MSVHVCVPHVQFRDRGRRVRHLQVASQARSVPGSRYPQVRREHPRHLPHRGREGFEDREVDAVGPGPDGERVGQLPVRHGREREIERQVHLHIENLLPRAPQVQRAMEALTVVVERAVDERRAEPADRDVRQRERTAGHRARAGAGESRRHRDHAAGPRGVLL